MMLFLHLKKKPIITLTTVLYLSCALISGHLAMMLMELTNRRFFFFLMIRRPPRSTLFSLHDALPIYAGRGYRASHGPDPAARGSPAGTTPSADRKSTRLNSSHVAISYAVFCLKKKKREMSNLLHKTKKKKKQR